MKDIFSDEVLDQLDGAIEKSMSARTFGVGELVAGRYKVERTVGRGNFGFVYRVLDTETNKKRALKTFYEKFASRGNVRAELAELGRQLTELKHPNLVRVFDVGEDGDLLFFVEEFVSALTLDRLVDAVRKHAADKGFPPDQMAEVIGQVTAALEEAPDQPHLNLTPQNIFMSKAGIKVADYGVVRVLRSVLEPADIGVLSGRKYWAPEFVKDGVVNASADVFSLGRLLGYLLTLGADVADLRPGLVRGRHPRQLIELANSAAAADPDQRLPNCSAFIGAFEAARLAPIEEMPEEPAAEPEEERLAEAAEEALSAVSEKMTAEASDEALSAVSEAAAAETPVVEGEPIHEHAEQQFFGEAFPEGELPAVEEELPPLPGEAEAPAPPAEAEVPTMAKPAAKKGVPGWAIAAIIILALGATLYAFRDRILPPAEVTPVPIEDSDTFELDGIKIMPEPGGPTFEEMIDALLLQAKTYVDTNRLTDPPDDSAFALYSLILEMDPKNKPATEGVEAIMNRYLSLGRAFMSKKNYKRAEWAFRKALFVDDGNAEAKSQLAKIAQLKPEETPVVATGPTPAPGVTPAPGATPPPIAATPAPGQVLSRITGTEISATVSRYMGRVRFCMAKNPNATGVVKIRFVINPSGKVTSASVASSTLGIPEIEQCLVRRVLLMKFPAFEGSAKTVTFPFRLGQ